MSEITHNHPDLLSGEIEGKELRVRFETLDAFISALYEVLLKRDVDEMGMQFHRSNLTSGTHTITDVVRMIASAPELAVSKVLINQLDSELCEQVRLLAMETSRLCLQQHSDIMIGQFSDRVEFDLKKTVIALRKLVSTRLYRTTHGVA